MIQFEGTSWEHVSASAPGTCTPSCLAAGRLQMQRLRARQLWHTVATSGLPAVLTLMPRRVHWCTYRSSTRLDCSTVHEHDVSGMM